LLKDTPSKIKGSGYLTDSRSNIL